MSNLEALPSEKGPQEGQNPRSPNAQIEEIRQQVRAIALLASATPNPPEEALDVFVEAFHKREIEARADEVTDILTNWNFNDLEDEDLTALHTYLVDRLEELKDGRSVS